MRAAGRLRDGRLVVALGWAVWLGLGAPRPAGAQPAAAPSSATQPAVPAPQPAPTEADVGPPLPRLAAELAPPPEVRALLGRPIVAVEVEAPAGEDAASIGSLVDIAPGYLLDASQVQRAIERLYALGRFAQIEARVDAVGEAVVLRFVLLPIVRLDEIYLRGGAHMNADALRTALRLQSGEEVDSQTEALLKQRALAHAARVGYPGAQVRISTAPGSVASTVALRLHMDEGPADRVADVQIVGDRRVAQGILLSGLQLRRGDVLDFQALERARLSLEEKYVERGFVRAEVKLLPPTYVTAGKGAPRRARVQFAVQAHERVTFAFVGLRLSRPEALMALWPGRMGGPPQAALGLFAQRIRAHYQRESYPNVRVQVSLRPPKMRRQRAARLQHTSEVVVRIEEGAPLWVSAVRIEGAATFPNDILRRQVLAVLSKELGEDSFFAPLGPGHQMEARAPQYGLDWAPHRVPAENRWVPDLYNRAADDMAAAYRAVGFQDVVVTVPAPEQVGAQEDFAGPDDALEADDADVRAWPTNDDAMSPRAPAFGPDASAHGPQEGARLRRDVDASAPFVRTGVRKPRPERLALAQIHVEEGPQHFVERLTLRGNLQVPSRQLLEVIAQARGDALLRAPLAPGAPFSDQGIEDARIAIVRHYREQGYVYVRAFATVEPLGGATGSHVTLSVEEGPQVKVEHVLVRGQRFTREGVIRSRISLKAGAFYRLDRAIADQQEVMALGTFSRARVKLVDEEHPSESKDVVVEVQERPRQLVEVVPGLSSASGPRLRLSYSHLNVLGTASNFVASFKVNRQMFFGLYGGPYAEGLRQRYRTWHGHEQLTRALEREVRLGLRSPRVKALPFDPLLRLDIVDQRVNAALYGLNSTTATFGVDTDLTPRLRASMEVQGGISELECPVGVDCTANATILRLRGGRPIQTGPRHTIKFGPILRYDHRDDPIAPSRGYVIQGRLSQAFGAATPAHRSVPFAFTKYEASATAYIPAFGAVFATSLRTGFLQLQRNSAPLDEQFFVGGRDSLRGFVEGTLIAQDACVVANDQVPLPAHCRAPIVPKNGAPPRSLGGTTFLLLKNEVRLPLGNNVSFDLFIDVGNLWVDLARAEALHLRVGTGVGLRYATPVGAMTLDFGVNPARRHINQEAAWQFHFSIGSF